MKLRVITAALMIVAVIIILLSDEKVLVISAALLSLLAAYEIAAAFGYNKKGTRKFGLYLMIGSLLTSILSTDLLLPYTYNTIICPVVFLYLVTGFLLVILCNEQAGIKDFVSALFMCTITVWFLMFAVKIKTGLPHGNLLIWSVFVGACFTDTFALFAGKFFGKHKLIPKISPNKTVEGAIGGTLGAVLMMIVYAAIISLAGNAEVNYPLFALMGLISAVLAQIGDLTYSALKRQAGIKDFGNMFPGHGGILDRIDSIIFVAPAVYFYLKFMPCII